MIGNIFKLDNWDKMNNKINVSKVFNAVETDNQIIISLTNSSTTLEN